VVSYISTSSVRVGRRKLALDVLISLTIPTDAGAAVPFMVSVMVLELSHPATRRDAKKYAIHCYFHNRSPSPDIFNFI